ncbi:hypothetical protein [Brevundimonas lenta]|uniref:Peptidase M1 membrane alanine aminopeptidase domain-containing protein n=1 Tax=Brevundimonas lenta TaxID=424796 RepID=A0A7W6JG83_9CAUL|nr:hypothetical protein [Brevundimonas lenta]MBB4083536.1 hypothetical protein [Brevundimonas lenta]
MRLLITAAAAAIALSSQGSASAAGFQAEDAAPTQPAVTVTRDGDAWTAEYEFDRDAAVWAFFRSSLIDGPRRSWRLDQWRVVTPGVVLERVGSRDILRTVDGGPVPRRVTIAFKPKTENLEADYGVLSFSDGAVALPTGHFDVFPVASVEAARQVPDDLNGYPLETGASNVTWRDRAGPILFRGQRVPEATAIEADTYVLFGQADLVEGARMTTVIDPQLPSWISAGIEGFAPQVADYYAQRLGPGQTERPTIMVSWAGPTPGLTSMGGSVMPGLIVMNFDGVGVVQPSAGVLGMSRWFIGHESAHFWLGQTVRYERARDAWITEGGADLMAIRALKSLDPVWDDRAELQKEVDDCADLAVRPVASAGERGEHRAYYACGAVFALVAEGVQGKKDGGDWFAFLKPLIDASREDGVLSRDEWLSGLTSVSGGSELRKAIETLLDDGSADPAAAIAALFDRAGVPHRLEAGRVVLS